ncbi:hypothetical protein HMPREF3231_02245, partial [Bifidobacterium longum]
MGFRHDRASAGRSHEPLARGAHGAGPARTVLAGLVAVATLATGGLVASTAYAGGAGDNRPGGATGGLPAGMFWQYKDDASGSFGPAANADGSPRIASVEAAYKRAGVSVVNDGVYDGPGAIRDTLRGALSKCVAGFRQRHPGEGDGDCRVVGVGSVAGQQGGRWVYNGSGGYSASEWYSSWDSQIKPGTFQYGSIFYKTSYPFDDDPSTSVDKIAYDNIARAGATPNLIIIVLDKYQPKPPTYHLSVSTQAAEMSGQSGDTKDASDTISLSSDGSKTENVNGTATLHWRGIDGTEKTVAKRFTASNKGSATVSASFKDMDASWESWPAGKRWWDVDVAKQGGMAEAVSHKGENDGKESGEKTTTPPEKWLTNGAGDTVRDGNDSIASGSLYTAHIKAHSNASGKFWIYDTIDTRDVVIGGTEQ